MKIDKNRLYTVAAVTLALAVMIPLVIACLSVIRSARTARTTATTEHATVAVAVATPTIVPTTTEPATVAGVDDAWHSETIPSLGLSLNLPPTWTFTVERLGPMFSNPEGTWDSENGRNYWTISEGKAHFFGEVKEEPSYKIGNTVSIDSTQWPDEEVKAGPTSCDDPGKPSYITYKNQHGVTVTFPCLHGEDDPYSEFLTTHGGFGLRLGGRTFSTCMNIWAMTEAGIQHALTDLRKTLDSVSLDEKVANKANSNLALQNRPLPPLINEQEFAQLNSNGVSIAFPPDWRSKPNDDHLPTDEDMIPNYERGAEGRLQWMNSDIHLEIVTRKDDGKGNEEAVNDFIDEREERILVKTDHMEGVGYRRELSCSDDFDPELACQFGQRLALTSRGKLFLVWVGFSEPTMARLIQRVARWEKMLDTLQPDIKTGQ